MTTHENNGIQGAINKKGEANFWLRLFYLLSPQSAATFRYLNLSVLTIFHCLRSARTDLIFFLQHGIWSILSSLNKISIRCEIPLY
jgi:hypothetical protein